nr:DUF1801 domain-containing protein [Cytophagales bacterium]
MENVAHFLEQLPEDRRNALISLRKIIIEKLPHGFAETFSNGMIHFVVPHEIYPRGYHCDPKQPLPFISLTSQRNHIALYHMGIYAKPEILQWFAQAYSHHSKTKLDMGKSCIRFKNPATIPFVLIGELCTKVGLEEWIRTYESTIKR